MNHRSVSKKMGIASAVFFALLLSPFTSKAQFVISLQAGGSYATGSTAFESTCYTISPLTGDDTIIYDSGESTPDVPLGLTIGLKVGYQTRKAQFGIAGSFSYNHVSGDLAPVTYLRTHSGPQPLDSISVLDSLIGQYSQYRFGYTIAPYIRYELIQLGDLAFFAELCAYYTYAGPSQRREYLDWYRREMHHTIDTSYSIPVTSTSFGARITPGLSWQLSPKCYVDLYFDILALSADFTKLDRTTVVTEWNDTGGDPIPSIRTETHSITSTSDFGFGVVGTPLLSNRNWVRAGFTVTF